MLIIKISVFFNMHVTVDCLAFDSFLTHFCLHLCFISRSVLVGSLCMLVAVPIGIASFVLHRPPGTAVHGSPRRPNECGVDAESNCTHADTEAGAHGSAQLSEQVGGADGYSLLEALLESLEAILTGDTLDAPKNACYGYDGVGGATPLPLMSCALHFAQIWLGALCCVK